MKNEHWEVTPEVTCIKLTQGRYALVDTIDLPKIAHLRWCASRAKRRRRPSGEDFYAVSSDGPYSLVKMHRVILKAKPGTDVDHFDGNGLNNSSINGRLNISVSSRRNNIQNRHHPKSSVFPGVVWHKNNRRYRALILAPGHKKQTLIGSFQTDYCAYLAYQLECKRIGSL